MPALDYPDFNKSSDVAFLVPLLKADDIWTA